MIRSDKFLPIPHFSELLSVPRVSIFLLAVCVIWVLCRRRDLLYLAGITLAGGFLLNHQVITGLQIENWHWFYVFGPSLNLLSLLLLFGAFWHRDTGARISKNLLGWALVAVVAVTGVWIRVAEATRSGRSARIAEAVRQYQDQRAGDGVPRMVSNAVLGGDPFFVEAASIAENLRPLSGYIVLLSGTVDDTEWDSRVALNAYLRGLNREEFADEERTWLDKNAWGPWAPRRGDTGGKELLRKRLASWDVVQANPEEALERFRVRYLALPAKGRTQHLDPRREQAGDEKNHPARQLPAEERTQHLKGHWTLIQSGPFWEIWERDR